MPILRRLFTGRRRNVETGEVQDMELTLKRAVEMYNSGKFQTAEVLYREVLAGCQTLWGVESLESISISSNLGLCLMNCKRHEEGTQFLSQAVSQSLRGYGELHPVTITAQHNLAMAYLEQRRYVEAEPVYRQVISSATAVFGAEDHRALTSQAFLAVCLKAQGDLAKLHEADRIERSVWKIRKKSYDPKDHLVVQSLAALGKTLYQRGKLEAAERIQRRVLRVFLETQGEESQSGVWALVDLAVTLSRQDKFDQAEDLLRRGVSNAALVFGPGSTNHIRAVNFLTEVLTDQGKIQETAKVRTMADTFGA